MEKLIITAALTGNITLPTQTPYLPLTPEQIADEAVRAADAGAASIHVHGRDPKTGRPTTDPEVYREIATLIKALTDAIVCVTTGGTPYYLIQALRNHGAKNLTIVANTAGGTGLTLDYDDHKILFENRQVKKVIATFPFYTAR